MSELFKDFILNSVQGHLLSFAKLLEIMFEWVQMTPRVINQYNSVM